MSSKVLPPANGKKLWRVKKTQPSRHSSISSSSTTSHQSNASLNSIQTSMECLNNSLRIAAAASKFTIKRPPLRRPKNKPGKPKDFVFVDLSPVQSEDTTNDNEEKKPKQMSTPASSRRSSSISSIASVTSAKSEPPSTPMTANTSMNSINDLPLPVLSGCGNSPAVTTTTTACGAPIQPYPLSNNNEGFGLPSPVESLDDFLISEFDLWDNNWDSMIPPQQQQPQQQTQPEPQPQQSFQEFLDIVSIVQQQQEQIQQLQQQLQQITTIPSSTTNNPTMSTNKFIDFSF
ncbi:predicted protein [Candida tropicalis MYA-3404]|uniref:Uncharacterized protein n=1 Tax=Candida tropicalis (strain ATCC MYA-3404 / T1) TaxID=294747 RepID=C5MGR8_CANTT|nr:predicted protein [Candida tropicalis MYA-3404]EER30820.1 predicted protein [Candida tropicalis MYA-3404]KAG4404378.1 hypothetical protein JTP64_006130 [Candida tropicalis]